MTIVVPNLQALRHWLMRLDARLVSSELQLRWLAHEKQALRDRRELNSAFSEMGLLRLARGGQA